MTTPLTPAEHAVLAAVFAAHLQGFHRGLPLAEQQLLEQVLARAAGRADDTAGHLPPGAAAFRWLVAQVVPALVGGMAGRCRPPRLTGGIR